jgi:proton glutamate symport protein
MIEAAEVRLGLSPQVTGVVLPLAVSIFRFSTPIWLTVASFFVARLYNIALTPTQIAMVGFLSVLMSIGGIGLPSGASYFAPITPVFLSVGLPLEAIAILFAVDTIPDTVETASNVTADMTATTIVNHHAGEDENPGRNAYRLIRIRLTASAGRPAAPLTALFKAPRGRTRAKFTV